MVSCGDLNARKKTVTSQGRELELYFHAGKMAPLTKLRGFRVVLRSKTIEPYHLSKVYL